MIILRTDIRHLLQKLLNKTELYIQKHARLEDDINKQARLRSGGREFFHTHPETIGNQREGAELERPSCVRSGSPSSDSAATRARYH